MTIKQLILAVSILSSSLTSVYGQVSGAPLYDLPVKSSEIPIVSLTPFVDGKIIAPVNINGESWFTTSELAGTEYQLRLTNHESKRVAAVVGIDGVSIVGKQPFSFLASGYVLNPLQSVIIDGWRTGNDEIEAFKFAGPQLSIEVVVNATRGSRGQRHADDPSDAGDRLQLKEVVGVVDLGGLFEKEFDFSDPVVVAVHHLDVGFDGETNR